MIYRISTATCLFLVIFSGLFLLNNLCEFLSDIHEGKPMPLLYDCCEAMAPIGLFLLILPLLGAIIGFKHPLNNPVWFIVGIIMFGILLTGGIALEMHCYLNGAREITPLRYVVNCCVTAILILILAKDYTMRKLN